MTQKQLSQAISLLRATHRRNQNQIRLSLGILLVWFAVGVFLLLYAALQGANVAGMVSGGIVAGLVAIPSTKLLTFVKQNQVLDMLPALLLMLNTDARSSLIQRAIEILLDGGKGK